MNENRKENIGENNREYYPDETDSEYVEQSEPGDDSTGELDAEKTQEINSI